MSGSSPTFFHSPAVVALARGAVLIGVLAVLFLSLIHISEPTRP